MIDAMVVKFTNKNPDKVVTVPPEWTPQTRLECYSQMCAAIELGLVRSVGVCNFSLRQLQELVAWCTSNALPLPVVVQNEFHPFLHVHAAPLIAYCRSKNIAYQAHSSLGGPAPKQKKAKATKAKNDTGEADYSLLDNEVVVAVAQMQQVTPATVLFRWARSQGVTSIIAKSSNKARIEENRQICAATFDDHNGGGGGGGGGGGAKEMMNGLDLGHEGNTCFTWLRETDPDEY